MKRFERFLFFYGIVAVTVLFISYGIFAPLPLNFISALSMVPIVFYFWIRLTSPEAVGAEKWSIRFLIVLALLGALGIFGFHLHSLRQTSPYEEVLKKQLAEAQRKNEEISAQLASAGAKLELNKQKDTEKQQIQGESVSDLLLETPPSESTPSGVQRIMGKAGVTTISVYRDPNTSSPKIGALQVGLKYPYLEEKDGWYKVVVTSSQTGWVSQSQVQEVN